MKGLDSLIKLHKRTLDELRRSMAALERQKDQLQQAIHNLQLELEKEMALAKKQAEMSGFFGDFAKRIKNRQAEHQESIRKLDKQILKLNDEIAAAFAEVKKFEIAKENRKRRALEEQSRKETIMLDEIAGQQYTRKQKE